MNQSEELKQKKEEEDDEEEGNYKTSKILCRFCQAPLISPINSINGRSHCSCYEHTTTMSNYITAYERKYTHADDVDREKVT